MMTPAATHTESSDVYEPILDTKPSKKHPTCKFPPSYGGFEYQKRVWESTARRSYRIRFIAVLQLVLGFLASWNYLWYVFRCVCLCVSY